MPKAITCYQCKDKAEKCVSHSEKNPDKVYFKCNTCLNKEGKRGLFLGWEGTYDGKAPDWGKKGAAAKKKFVAPKLPKRAPIDEPMSEEEEEELATTEEEQENSPPPLKKRRKDVGPPPSLTQDIIQKHSRDKILALSEDMVELRKTVDKILQKQETLLLAFQQQQPLSASILPV